MNRGKMILAWSEEKHTSHFGTMAVTGARKPTSIPRTVFGYNFRLLYSLSRMVWFRLKWRTSEHSLDYPYLTDDLLGFYFQLSDGWEARFLWKCTTQEDNHISLRSTILISRKANREPRYYIQQRRNAFWGLWWYKGQKSNAILGPGNKT